MMLERVISVHQAITEISTNSHVRGNTVLRLGVARGSARTVFANTGQSCPGEIRGQWRTASPGQTAIRMGSRSVEADGSEIVIMNRSERAEVGRLSGHAAPVTALTTCSSRGTSWLVSASEDGDIRMWDPHTGKLHAQAHSGATMMTTLISYIGPDDEPRIVSGGPRGVLCIWNPWRPAPPRTGQVATRGFSDRVARVDLLDRGALISALADVLKPGDDGPTVITVEGAWGTGKSTVLELVRQAVATEMTEVPAGSRFTVWRADWTLYRPRSDQLPSTPPTKPLVVSFNPWRHQSSEQVWAGLAKAVADAAHAAIMPGQNTRERYWFARNAHRVDRRHLQRQLWKRIFSPLLSFAGLGFGLATLGALTKLNIGWAWWVTAGLAMAGVVHTGLRYLFGRASAFLPDELFAGPVVSNRFSGTTTDPLIRDPYYHAKSGYLYLVQHDVAALLADLAAHGYQVVILIDDLDRCTPRTTAQVFEAINVFLSEDFPSTRFVLGLDTVVVASHVDHAYKELADAKVMAHADDPSPGWTFLRKLVQLPVRLPRTTGESLEAILTAQLGEVSEEADPVTLPSVVSAERRRPSRSPSIEVIEKANSDREVVAIERNPTVRHRLRRKLQAQAEQSVREEKRLLNVWQFYLRVLGVVEVEQACHLVSVAEIAVRWPAYLHRLHGRWDDLATAVDDDVRWGAIIAKLGLGYSDRTAAANLRALLRDCDAQTVAGLANRLF
jgi:hypothetical protein